MFIGLPKDFIQYGYGLANNIMKKIILILLLASGSVFADKYTVARTITVQDLNQPCPGKYMEWFAMSNTDEQWGSAQVKVF